MRFKIGIGGTHFFRLGVALITLSVFLFTASLFNWQDKLGAINVALRTPDKPAAVLQDAKIEKPKLAQPIEKDKKIFEPGEDPQFSVGELITPKKTDVALASVSAATKKTDSKENSEFLMALIAPNGQKNTEAIVVQNGEVKIDHTKISNFRPGIYKVVVGSVRNGEPVTQEKEFAWGVLTVNTDKSIYLPGDSAYIQMAALDDFGYTLCGADLKLEIIDPQGFTSNQEIKKSDSCSPESVTGIPDYFAYYKIQNLGKYTIRLTNNQNGFIAENSFEVAAGVPFVVQRSGATRINPFAADYTMGFSIKANQDFFGTITETLPNDFEITKSENANISKNDSSQQISWNVSLTSGQQISLQYTYRAPQTSPQLFLLGPLQFIQNNQTIFAETRQWQIASDGVKDLGALGTQKIDSASVQSLVAQDRHITGKYRFANSQLVLPARDKNQVQTEVGEAGSAEFTPDLTISKWNGEASFTVKPDAAKASQLELNGEQIGYKTGRKDYVYYDDPTASENGGYEFKIVLNQKPETNTFSETIDSTGVDFYPQLPLDEEPQRPGVTCTATECKDSTGRVVMQRPEDAVDSIAVYATGKSGDFTAMGGMNYMAGKVAQIKRVKAIDATGNWAYCKQTIANGIWTKTCPQDFLDHATYPVVIDPTFGYGGAGSSQATFLYIHYGFGTGAAGSVSKITAVVDATSGQTQQAALYVVSTLAKLALTSTVTGVNHTKASQDFTFSSPPGISAINYYIGLWGNGGNLYADSGSSTGNKDSSSSYAWPNWPATTNLYDQGTILWTAYATYTAAVTCTSQAGGGNWSNAGKWDCGHVPSAADNVVIASGNPITVDATTNTINNLTINNGATLTGASGQTLNVAGAWTNNGTFTQSTGTVSFATGWSMPTPGTLTFYNLTIAGTPTTQPAGSFTVSNALTVNSGASLSPTGGTITFNTAGGSISNSGTLAFQTLSITAAGTVTGTGNFSAVTSFAIGSGATFQPAAAEIVSGAGTLSGSGTAQVTRTAATPDFSSQYTITNKTLASLTVEYTAASAQTVSSLTYGGLKISNTSSAVATLAGAVTVGLDLTIASGSALDTSSSNYTVTLQGNFTNSGTFTANASPITISGSAAQAIAGFTTTGLVSMTKTGGTATLGGNVGGAGLTISGVGGTLNLGSGLTHTFTGDVTLSAGTLNGGSSTLNENNTSATAWGGTGSLFTAGTGTVSFGGAAQTLSVSATTFNVVTFAGTGTKTLSSATVANGTLTINSGVTLATANNAVTFGGDFVNSGGTFTAGSSPITIAGTATQSIAGFTTTGLVSMTKTGNTATLGGNMSCSGLTINGSGGTLDLGAGLSHATSNTVTLTAGTLLGNTSTLTVSAGDWTNNGGTFTPNTGNVIFSNTGANQNINGTAAAQTFNNITLSDTNQSVTVGATGNTTSLVVGGNLTVNSNTTFTPAAPNINIIGNSGDPSSQTQLGSVDRMVTARFQAVATGTLKNLQVYSAYNGELCKLAIYSDSGALPGTLLATTGEITTTASTWNTASISDVSIVSGNYYWLSIAAGAGFHYRATSAFGGTMRYKTITYSGFSFPDPAGTLGSTDTYNLSLRGYGLVQQVVVSGSGTLTGAGTAQVTGSDFSSQYTIANKTYTNLTVDYAGSAAQTVSNVAYGNLKISNTVGASPAAATTVNGNLTIASGAILTDAANHYGIAVNGGWANSGTFTPGTDTVTLGGSDQAITGTANFNNLTLSGSGTKTFSGAGTIAATLAISGSAKAGLASGTNTAANALTLGGLSEPSGTWGSTTAGKTYQNDTYFASSTGYVTANSGCTAGTWTGATNTDWSDASNWCGGVPTATTDVTIPSGGNQPTIGAAGGLCRNITLNSGSTLTMGGAYTLTVSGDWTNNGGTFNSGGGGGSITLRPNATGDETNITSQYPDSTSHWDKVDDPGTNDGDSTYVEASSGSYLTDAYNVPDQSLSGTISNVTIYYYAYNSMGIGSSYGKTVARLNGTDYLGDENSLPSGGYGAFSTSYNTSPATSAAWTWSEINNLQIGISLKNNPGFPTRCTQVYAVVTYAGTSVGTVTFNKSGDQSIGGSAASHSFNNLTLSGSGNKTFGAVATIAGNLTISGSAKAALANTTNSSANALYFGTAMQTSGSWGSSGSSATNKTDTYFLSSATGYVTAATGCTAGTWQGTTSTDWNTATNWCGGSIPTSTTDVVIPSGGNQPSIGSAGGTCRNITINDGATLTMSGAYNLAVSGDWTINGAGAYTPGTGTVTFNSTSADQNINGTATSKTFYNLTIDKSGKTLAIGGSTTGVTISRNLTITNGSFADGGAQITGNASGTFTMASGTNLCLGGTSCTVSSATATTYPTLFTNANTTLNAASTITYLSSNSQAVSGTPTSGYGNLTFAPSTGTPTYTLGAATVVNGNLTIGAGATLADGGYSITMAGGDWINNGGTFTQTGTNGVSFTSTTADQHINGTAGTQSFGYISLTKSSKSLIVGGNTTVLNLTGGSMNAMNIISGIFDAGSAATINVSGKSWNVATGGSFTPETGTVNFSNTGGSQDITGAQTINFNNVTVSKSGQTISGCSAGAGTTLTIGGTLNITSGTFNQNLCTTLNIAGDFTNSGTFTHNNKTVVFNGTGAQSINGSSATTFYNLTINKVSGTATVGVAPTIASGGKLYVQAGTLDDGNLQIVGNSGATMQMDNGTTLKLQKLFPTNFTNGNITLNTGSTVLYQSSSAQTVSGVPTYANLTFTPISGSSTYTLGAATTVNGTLTINNGATLSDSTGNYGITAKGDWTVNIGGAFTPGTDIVTFNSTNADQNINGTAASQTFNAITVAKSAKALAVGGSTTALTANGTLTMTSGTFTAPATTNLASLILTSGTYTAGTTTNVTGGWTNNGGTFTPGTGTVVFNSTTADQNINGTAAMQTFNALTVDKTSKTLAVGGTTATLTLNGTLTMTSGTFTPPATTNLVNAVLNGGTYTAGTTTNVSGDWTNNGGAFSSSPSKLIGADSSSSGPLSANTFNLGRFTATASGTLKNIKINSSGSGNVMVAIYNESSSLPHNLLASSDSTPVVSGWNTISVSDVTIVSGTNYWLGFNSSVNIIDYTASGGTRVQNSATYSSFSFPNPVDASTWGSGSQIIGLAGWGITPVTGTVQFSNTTADQNINGSAASQTFNNITVDKSGHTLNVGNTGNTTALSVGSGTLTVNANSVLTPAAGVVVSGSGGTLTGAGTVQVTRTAATPDFLNQYTMTNRTISSLTVDYAGSGAQTVSDVSGFTPAGYGNLKISNGAGATLAAATTVNGNLTIGSGATLSSGAGNYNLNVTGDWTNNGGTFTPGSDTVTLGASGNQNINGTAASHIFNNLTLSGSGNKTFAATAAIAGNLTISGSAKAALTGATNTANQLYFGTGLQQTGSWGSSGSAATNKTDTYFLSTATGYVTASAGCTAGNWQGTTSTDWNTATNWCGGIPGATTDVVIPSGGNQPSIGAAGGLSRNLTINSGATLTVSGAYSLAVSGDWTNNSGTFTPGTGTVTFNNTGANQNINGTAITQTFNNLTLSDTGYGLNIGTTGNTTSLVINGALTINTNTTLTPAAGVIISGAGATGLTGSGTAQVTRIAATPDFSSQYAITNKTLTNLTVDYAGTGQQLSNLTYGNLKISGSITGAGSATFTGAFNNTGTFTPSSGTLVTSGTGWSIANSGTLTFQGLEIAGTPLTQPAIGFSIAGPLTVDSSQTFAPSAGIVTFTGGSIVNNGGATSNLVFQGLTINGTVSNSTGFSIAGALNVGASGNFSPSAGTVTFTGGSISNSNTLAFYGLTIATSGAFSASGNFSAAGNLTVNSGAIFQPAAAEVISGSGTLTGLGTAQVTRTAATPDFASQYTISNKTLDNLTVEYASGQPQTISAVNYGNLTSSSSGARTLAAAGTIGISGIFTPGSNAYTIAGSTIDFNGSAGETIPAFNYNNLTSSSTGARTLAGSGTIGILGAFTPGTNSFTNASSTIEFDGTTAQTIPAFTYYNLNIKPVSNSVTDTFASGTIGVQGNLVVGNGANTGIIATAATNDPNISVNGNVTVSGNTTFTSTDDVSKTLNIDGSLTINNGGIFTAPSGTSASSFTLGGDFTNNGTFNNGSGRITLDGNGTSASQTLSGTTTPTTFYQLYATAAAPRIVSFANGNHYAIADNGTLSLTGTDAVNTLTVTRAGSTGNWLLDVSNTGTSEYISYVNASWCDASGGKAISATSGNNINGGNNVNWLWDTAPSFTSGPSDNGSTGTLPTNVGSNVSFTATGDDAESNNYYLAICKSSNITAHANGAPTCDDGNWCVSSSTVHGVAASCNYSALSGDLESNPWFAFVCDYNTNPLCSAYSQGGVGDNGSPFKVNHAPIFSNISTNATSTVPLGGQVTFTAAANDTDTDTANDTVKLYVCKAGDWNGSGCGIAGEWCDSISAASNPTCNYTVQSGDGDGTQNFWAYIVGSHNFASTSSPRQSSFQTDVTPPTVTGLSNDNVPKQTKTWTWGASESATFRFVIDQNASTTISTAYDSTTTASQTTGNGTYYLHVQAKDTAGNEGNVTTVSAILDNSGPIITINNPTTDPAQSKTITASASKGTLTMSDTTGSVCDGSLVFIAYSSQTFTSQSNNGTKVCYKADDGIGNISYSLSNAISGIDTSAPNITVNNPNTNPAQSKTITASVSDGTLMMANTGGATCDGSLGFVAYADQTFTSESNNGTSVCYQATDSANNISYQMSNTIAGIDTTAPTINISNPDTTPAQSKTITASASDGAFAMSNTTGVHCDSSLVFVAYADQTFTQESDNGFKVCYQAIDAAGNARYSMSNAIAGIDITAPAITGLSDDTTPTKSKIWNWGASETATFRYLIDQNATSTISTSYNNTVTASQTTGDGTYYIHVQAKDAAGNESAITTVSTILDNTAPVISIANPNTDAAQTKTVTAQTSEGTLTMKVDAGSVCDATVTGFVAYADTTFTAEADNGKTICYKAVDTATNISYLMSSAVSGIDTTAPVINGLNNDSIPVKSKSWTWGSDDPQATYRYLVDRIFAGIPLGSYNASTTVAIQTAGDGTYYLHVQAKDAAGNESAVTTVSAILDNTVPTITINNPDSSTSQSKTITASTSDGTLAMSNTTGATCDATLTFIVYASQTFTSESDNGTKVCYKAIDTAGNVSYSLSGAIMGIAASGPTPEPEPTPVTPAAHPTTTAGYPGQAGPAIRKANIPVPIIATQTPVLPQIPPVVPSSQAQQPVQTTPGQRSANPINNITEPLQEIGQAILNILNPPQKITLFPVPAPVVPQSAPLALAGIWNLLPLSVSDFVLAPLPQDLQVVERQFPQLGQTFGGLGLNKITDLQKLQNAQITLPGLSESAGLASQTLSEGAIAPFTSLSLANLPQDIKQSLPNEFVFTGIDGIDLNSKLTLNDSGNIEQTVRTIVNQTVHLTMKVDQPALSVRGYLTVKNTVATRPNFFASLMASVSAAALGVDNTPPQNLLLQEFDYSDPDNDGIYEADVVAPAVDGQYDVMTAIKYADSTQERKELHMTLVVDPEGYVYELTGTNETRISKAQVSLFWMNPQTNNYELWPAKTWRQTNPQITGRTGQYSFLVPPGDYMLKVNAVGYGKYEGKPFEVTEGSGIHENIQLKPDHWDWASFDWKFWILTGILSILASVLIYIAIKIKQK